MNGNTNRIEPEGLVQERDMTKQDQEDLESYGRDIGQSVFPKLVGNRLGVSIGNMTTCDSDRAYMALRALEAEAR